jgi:hypothetical protein
MLVVAVSEAAAIAAVARSAAAENAARTAVLRLVMPSPDPRCVPDPALGFERQGVTDSI